MKWTKEKPTKEGRYWFKGCCGEKITVGGEYVDNILESAHMALIIKNKELSRYDFFVRVIGVGDFDPIDLCGLWSDQPIPMPEEAE